MSSTAIRHARPPADDATRQAARTVNKQKIEWVKEVGADPAISSAAARVAAMAALNLAYSKGCIRATHRHLGKLSGLPGRSVRRAVAELAEKYYWEIDATNGGANLYTLIAPEERLQLWLDAEDDHKEEWRAWLRAEKQYERDVRQWLDAEITLWLRAEKQFTQEWLDAEKRFAQEWLDAEEQYILEWYVAEIDAQHAYEMQVFNAVLDRCGNTDHAMAVAQAAWGQHRQGRLPLEAALEAIAQQPQDSFPDADVATPPATSGHPPVQLHFADQRKRRLHKYLQERQARSKYFNRVPYRTRPNGRAVRGRSEKPITPTRRGWAGQTGRSGLSVLRRQRPRDALGQRPADRAGPVLRFRSLGLGRHGQQRAAVYVQAFTDRKYA